MRINNAPERIPDAVPMQTFRAILEDFHHAVGVAAGISEPTRNLLLGRIEGYQTQHAFCEPKAQQEEALALIYAAERAAKIAGMTNMSLEKRKQQMRETLAEFLKKPPAPADSSTYVQAAIATTAIHAAELNGATNPVKEKVGV